MGRHISFRARSCSSGWRRRPRLLLCRLPRPMSTSNRSTRCTRTTSGSRPCGEASSDGGAGSPLIVPPWGWYSTPMSERKIEILKAAVGILAREGIDELTLNRVGTEVGIERSHVVYYFKSRDELVDAAVRFATLS